ncbi:MAG TPA: hypothetical protein VHU41_00430, partial [Thermoanaerobaculia bacterium]|nr:hypothetical protein [Thermoanaerobaculia bacterium]
MEMLRGFLDALTKFVPAEFVFGGGVGLVICVSVLVFIGLVIEAGRKNYVDALATWLKKDDRGLWVTTLALLFVLAVLANRPKSAMIIALFATIAVIVWLVRREPVAKKYLGAIALLGLISVGIEGLFTKVTVYVILPFEPSQGENLDQLLSVSKSLRNSMGGLLDQIANVRVEPAGFNAPKDLDDWREVE